MPIDRIVKPDGYTAAITAAVGTTADISYGGYSGGTIHIPTGSGLTSLTFHSRTGGNNYALYDSTGSAVTLTVAADRSYPIPAACFGCELLRIVGNTTGNIIVTLKG